MPVFHRELWANRGSWLIWTASMVGLVILMMSIYPSFLRDSANVEALMQAFPESFARVFGLDQLSIADATGYYAIEVYLMVMLFGSLYAASLAAAILAKEEDERTIEFLLARPISRQRMLTGKISALFSLLILFNLSIGLVTIASFSFFDVGHYSPSILLNLLMAPLFAHLAFASVAFAAALFFRRKKLATSMAIGLVLGLYFINVLATLSEKYRILRYFTPFYYVDATSIVKTGIEPRSIALLLAVVAVSITASFLLYSRRDITV